LGGSNLTLRADSRATGTGTVTFSDHGAVDFTGSHGQVEILYNPAPAGGHKYANPVDYSPFVRLSTHPQSTLTAYMLVNDLDDLQAINNNLAGTYALGGRIDAGATQEDVVFTPIGGSRSRPFAGVFDGRGHVIDGLAVGRSFDSEVGLFGVTGAGSVVRNVGLENVNVNGQRGVGALVGWNTGGTILNSYSTGTVRGTYQVGG